MQIGSVWIELFPTGTKALSFLLARGVGSGQGRSADTADILTEISRGIDKWLWLVEAHARSDLG